MSATARVLMVLTLWTGTGIVLAGDEFVELRTAFRDVKLTGFTRPRAAIRLISEEAGRFENVAVDIGDVLKKNQHFGCLDTTYADLDMAANKARQDRLRADLDYFTSQADRLNKLVNKNTTAQADLDDMVRRKAGARADLSEAGTRLRELTERKRRHCIAAPTDWTVTERLVEPGQWVSAGEAVGRVADFSGLLAPFALSYQEIQALKKQADGLQVYLPDEQRLAPAKAVHWNLDFNEQTRKTAVDLALAEGITDKRGGLRVELTLRLPDPSGALLAPGTALVERYEQYWVQLVDGTEVPVVYLGDLKAEGESWARIVSNTLKPGDRVRLR